MTMTMTSDARPSWEETWLAVAEAVSKRSRCSRAQMGSVIVSRDQHIISTGYNGPAANWPESGECINWCERAKGNAPLDNLYDACPSIHAEANALLYVDRSLSLGGTIYIVSAPCMQCAKLIANSGIAKVVCRLRATDMHRDPYGVFEFLKKCDIAVTYIKDHDVV
jgi:dCMP deaminase